MASRRRRRHGDDDSEDLSEQGSLEKQDTVNRIHDDHLSEDLELSEYESLDDESEDYATSDSEDDAPPEPEPPKKQSEDEKVKEEDHPVVDHKEDEEPKKIHILPNTKRESGDGKEESEKEHSPERSANDEKLTFKQEEEEGNEVDENPSFTPRAGAFFQHDMRTDEKAKNFRPRYAQRESKKWIHDRFILEEQMPKTNTDIIEEYGFDLRKQKGEEVLNKPKQSRNRNRQQRGGYGPPHRGRGNYSRRVNSTIKQQQRSEQANKPTQPSNRPNTRPQRRNRQSTEKTNDDSSKSAEQMDSNKEQETDEVKVSSESKSQESKPDAPKVETEFSSLLNVINKQEKTPKQDKPQLQTSVHSRPTMPSHSKMEARRPKRYSSLRQNTGAGAGDATTTRGWRKSENAPKYQSNFAKPNVQNPRFNQKKDENSSVQQQPSPSHAVTQPSVTTTTPPIPNEYSSQPDLTSVAMTMPYPPNPQFTHHQYYHNPAYQQLCQQMNDQLMVEQQLSNIPPPQTDGQTAGVPPEQLSLPPHINATGIPPHTQGVTSLLQQQQPMHLPTPYFSSPVPSSVMPQMPMGYPPNLIGQQVGGVTYFNTPSPPTLPQQQVTTNQLSPARRPTSAIPIKSPGSTQFGLPLTGVE